MRGPQLRPRLKGSSRIRWERTQPEPVAEAATMLWRRRLSFIEVDCGRLDHEPASTRHRVSGICGKVHHKREVPENALANTDGKAADRCRKGKMQFQDESLRFNGARPFPKRCRESSRTEDTSVILVMNYGDACEDS